MSTLLAEADAPATILDELDREDESRLCDPAPIVLPPRRPAPSESATPHSPSSRPRVLTRLLAMADTYRESGSLRQAIELYFGLIRMYADSPQAQRAEDRLLDVARTFEQAGELRQARGIYEQLL